MKRIILGSVLSLLFLTACQGSSGQAISTTEPQTVSSTFTPAPISSLDLSGIVVTPGELPAGYESGEIKADISDLPTDVSLPDSFFLQNLSYNGLPGGSVTILMYDDVLKTGQTYDSLAAQMPAGARLVDIGEIGTAVNSSSSGSPTVALTYMRCQAVISVTWIGHSNVDDLLAYAVNLDKRLSPFICRGESHE